MQKILSAAVVVMLLGVAGCVTITPKEIAAANFGPYPTQYQEFIQNYMQGRLKDPYSAVYRFGTPKKGFFQDGLAGGNKKYFGYIVPVGINGKNSYGGYTGESTSYFIIYNDNKNILDITDLFSDPVFPRAKYIEDSPATSPTTTAPAPAVASPPSADMNPKLARAVTMSNLAQVQSLLSQGADANTTGIIGPIIIQAASTGHADIVQALLEHGADANAKGTSGIASLTMAAMGHADVVKVLLEHGADINSKNSALRQAAATGHADIVQILLEHGADVNAKDNFGMTALTMATMRGQNDVAEVLRAHGAVATGLPGPSATGAPAPDTQEDTSVKKLKALKQMKDDGLIDETEFEARRKAILDNLAGGNPGQ